MGYDYDGMDIYLFIFLSVYLSFYVCVCIMCVCVFIYNYTLCIPLNHFWDFLDRAPWARIWTWSKGYNRWPKMGWNGPAAVQLSRRGVSRVQQPWFLRCALWCGMTWDGNNDQQPRFWMVLMGLTSLTHTHIYIYLQNIYIYTYIYICVLPIV